MLQVRGNVGIVVVLCIILQCFAADPRNGEVAAAPSGVKQAREIAQSPKASSGIKGSADYGAVAAGVLPALNLTQIVDEKKDVTLGDIGEDIGKWKAPLFLQKNYPYYLAGYDDDNRPLWICEFGKWNWRQLFDPPSPKITEEMDKYIQQAAFRVLQSLKNASTPEYPITEVVYIVDMDEVDLSQLTHLPSVQYLLNKFRIYRNLIVDHLGGTTIINTNFVAAAGMNLIRPIFASIFDKIEVFGTNKEAWLPILRTRFPRRILPVWYGGLKSWKPIAVYG